MTELEKSTPSLKIIMPFAGVPGFPQDTAVRKMEVKLADLQTNDRWA